MRSPTSDSGVTISTFDPGFSTTLRSCSTPSTTAISASEASRGLIDAARSAAVEPALRRNSVPSSSSTLIRSDMGISDMGESDMASQRYRPRSRRRVHYPRPVTANRRPPPALNSPPPLAAALLQRSAAVSSRDRRAGGTARTTLRHSSWRTRPRIPARSDS